MGAAREEIASQGFAGPGAAGTGTSGQFVLMGRTVSPPVKKQTISGNVSGQISSSETNATDNYTAALAISKIEPSMVSASVLLSVTGSDATTTPPEFPTGSQALRDFQDISENTAIAMSSVPFNEGDYIIIEWGFRTGSTSVANATRNGSDAAQVTFDQDIKFLTGVQYVTSFASTPADNNATGVADGVASTVNFNSTVSVKGTLCIVDCQVSNAASGDVTVTTTGGQTWFGGHVANGNDQALYRFWCVFNGTWSANPQFTCAALSGTQPFTAVGHMVLPPTNDPDWTWISAHVSGTTFAAAADINVPGATVHYQDCFALAAWCSNDDNTWSFTTNQTMGWTHCFGDSGSGLKQVRNLAGADQSYTAAFRCLGFPDPDAIDFNGSTVYATRGAGLTGAADSKSGIFSCTVILDSNTGYILSSNNACVAILVTGGNFTLICNNTGGSTILNIGTVNDLPLGRPVHILASWDLNATISHIYIDDVSDQSVNTRTNDTIDYTATDWDLGAQAGAHGFKLDGALAELYFAPGQYLDFSVEANRRKFRAGDGRPVDLGQTGMGPTGVRPLIYFSNRNGQDVAEFATANKGSGGNFVWAASATSIPEFTSFGGKFTEDVSMSMGGVGTDAGVYGLQIWAALLKKPPEENIQGNRTPYNTLLRM